MSSKGNVNENRHRLLCLLRAMIYGFAGPEIAVGPRLGLDADASITVPAKGDPTFAFNASLKCGGAVTDRRKTEDLEVDAG